MLEAEARNPDPASEWTNFEGDANNPLFGYFRFATSDRLQPPWVRELQQNSVLQQLSGVGGITLHYFGDSLRANHGAFLDYSGRGPRGV